MLDLPTITLDTTLTDLYARTGPSLGKKRIGQVLCGTSSAIELNQHFPRNIKYLYQDSPFSSLPQQELIRENDKLKYSLASKYLSLIPQREAFIAGNTRVFLFNVNLSNEQIHHDEQEAKRTIAVLNNNQQPTLVFCPGPEHIDLEKHGVDVLASKLVLDALDGYPLTCDPEIHWLLNTKEALARSGLPTPRCDIVELEGYCADRQDCCAACKDDSSPFVPECCTGPRSIWLQQSVRKVIKAVRGRSLPFVAKNQQTFAGAGTWIINTDQERDELVEQLSSGLLRKLFSQVTAINHTLKPATILLSDMVVDPIANHGLTFFVCEDGASIYLGTSEQMIDENSSWIGSTITYSQQNQLEDRFSPIVNQVATWLHSHGYVGPVGTDVLQTQSSGDTLEQSLSFSIVDVNVRTSGSMCLPLLRKQFTSRGFDCASSFGITTKATRDGFIQEWSTQFQDGQMCLLAWYEDKFAGESFADIAISAKDNEGLRTLMKQIKATTEEVTF